MMYTLIKYYIYVSDIYLLNNGLQCLFISSQ